MGTNPIFRLTGSTSVLARRPTLRASSPPKRGTRASASAVNLFKHCQASALFAAQTRGGWVPASLLRQGFGGFVQKSSEAAKQRRRIAGMTLRVGGAASFGALLSCITLPAFADDQSVETVTVTAAHLPEAVGRDAFSVVTLDRAALSGSDRLDAALEQVPGLSLFRRSNSVSANPTIQGVSLRDIAPS